MTLSERISDPPAERPGMRRQIYAWAMYDWANSAYTSLSITVLMFFISRVVVHAESDVAAQLSARAASIGMSVPVENWGATAFAWGISLSTLVAAVLSPITGAMADARANKRTWLMSTAMCGAVSSCLLALVPAGWGWVSLALFFLMSLCFELSFGFYNGFLPELASEANMDRVSALGFSFGYVGGGLALGLAFLVFQFGAAVGITSGADQLRAGLWIMGLWWGLFSLPALIILRDQSPPRAPDRPLWQTARFAAREVRATLGNIRSFSTLATFLLGYLFFNDGIQTVISQASVFAEREIKFEPQELLVMILAFQFICLPGALLVGFVTDKLGQKRTLMICLAIWVLLLTAAYFIQTKAQFWGLSLLLGLVLGGSQSVSRAMMAVMTPPRRTAEFFGFFNFSGRATSWIGTFLFGLVMAQTGSARLAILSLLALFIIGWAITAQVDVARGQREAQQA
jgi:UMF1 family MFS transporter